MDIISFLQQHGYSRRTIISLLQDGAIRKNNIPISYRKEPINIGDSVILNNQQPIIAKAEKNTYSIILFNKPQGYVVSKVDPHNTTIYDILPPDRRGTYSYMGRLDKDSRGLLVLTDATALISFFSHPRYNHNKVYHVTVDKPLTIDAINQGKAGIQYHDVDTNEHQKLTRHTCRLIHNTTYEVIISEGKKRHIRRLIAMLGYSVTDLCRVQFGPWSLGNIKTGTRQTLPISSSDVENLLANESSYIQTQI